MHRGIESSSGVFTQPASSSFNNPHRINLLLIFAILYCAVNNALAQSTTICIGTPDAKAEGSTTRVVPSNHTMVLAQSNTQETDGTIYTAEVIQIDGSKKVVTYYRNIRGAIIAPPIVDGKLVDGNKAPDNPVEARIAQKDILVKYDKNAQIMLALVSKDDIIRKADNDLSHLLKLANDNKLITKGDIFTAFYSIYITEWLSKIHRINERSRNYRKIKSQIK